MQAIGKWLVGAVLGWLFDLVRDWYLKRKEKERKEQERKDDNEAAVEKLEQAETEDEVVEAGSDLLRR
jgi:hypothetical protein